MVKVRAGVGFGGLGCGVFRFSRNLRVPFIDLHLLWGCFDLMHGAVIRVRITGSLVRRGGAGAQ
ncbi:hypothetical protein CQ011_17220 [Arthrobacter sp. MYb213]|nr:hypothetical protein CQ011_17220 [Arthrobacter sp. MYb213]